MPRLGTVDYVTLSVPQARSCAETLAERFGARTFTKEELAEALGHETTHSGAFNGKLADLRRYGLVTGRGDELNASPLAQRLAHPANPAEAEDALEELVSNVPLLRELRRRFPHRVPDQEELFRALVNLTGVDRKEAEERLDEVQDQFSAAVRALLEARGSLRPHRTPSSGNGVGGDGAGEPPAEDPATITFEAGPVRQEFPLSPEGVESLRTLFRSGTFWDLLNSLVEDEGTEGRP